MKTLNERFSEIVGERVEVQLDTSELSKVVFYFLSYDMYKHKIVYGLIDSANHSLDFIIDHCVGPEAAEWFARKRTWIAAREKIAWVKRNAEALEKAGFTLGLDNAR